MKRLNYERLISVCDGRAVDEINNLLRQLSDNPKLATRETLAAKLLDTNRRIIVAKDEGRIIGMLYLSKKQGKNPHETVAKIDNFVVDADYRRQGIASQLLQFMLLVTMFEWKCDYVWLTSRPARQAARALYEKFGFRIAGSRGDTDVLRLDLPKGDD